MLTLGKQVSIEDAESINESSRNRIFGCIDTVYCENCGYANIDSLCLCIGINYGFICLNCGKNVLKNPIIQYNSLEGCGNDKNIYYRLTTYNNYLPNRK